MNLRPQALIDTNVLVAALEGRHEHHGPSVALFDQAPDGTLAVGAHALAETYSTLTRANGLFRWTPAEAWQGVASLVKVTRLVALSPAGHLDAVRTFAQAGGIGPRIYDYLIGEAAVQNGIDRIITWNTSHMRSLFPSVQVNTPTEGDWL